jgi:hypothetical protein
MAWRVAKSVVKGEIDNRARGTVTGKIWLLGRDEPLALNLAGNCWRDLAGFRFAFTNPYPQPGDNIGLDAVQDGKVGDITASRKVRDVPMEDIGELMAEPGENKGARWPLVNCLYLEWYSNNNGRVVVESTKFKIQLGEQAWALDEEGENDQRAENQKTICNWLDEVVDRMDREPEQDFDPADEAPMDEFQWEKFMKESDVRTDKYSKLLDQYMDHPDRDRIVAREMGWTWIEEIMDAEDKGALEESGDKDPFGDVPDLVPNPLTEGTDWVRNEHGHVEHPLCLRTRNVAMEMWHHAEKLNLLGENGDEDLRGMIFQAQMAGAKLAGALNHLAYDDERDGGFLVAALKRALNYLHDALSHTGTVAAKKLIEPDRLKNFEKKLFEIREEILALMKHYREDVR